MDNFILVIDTANSCTNKCTYSLPDDRVNFSFFSKNGITIFVDGYICTYDGKEIDFQNEKSGKLFDFIIELLANDLFAEIDGINGHYNIIVCNMPKGSTTVITDRYGMRPLYWYCKGERIIISTRVSVISQSAKFDKAINYDAIIDFIKFGWVTNDATFFKNISRFSSGSVYTFSDFDKTVRSYWNWPYSLERNSYSVDENAERGHHFIQQAVERVSSGVSTPAVTISGGLDSRIVAGFLAKSDRNLVLYHCSNNIYETIGAREVAKTLSLNLTECSPLKLSDEDFKMDLLLLADGCISINQFWLHDLFQTINNEQLTNCVFDGFFLDMLLNPPDFMSYHYGLEDKITEVNSKKKIADTIYGLPEGYIKKYFLGSQLKDISETALQNIDYYLSGVEVEDAVYFSQILYLMTRGKRYALMMPNINQNFCGIRFPGLDYNLIDFCLNLPVSQFKTPFVYLKIFERYFPGLNNAVWAKTGLSLNRGTQAKKKMSVFLSELNLLVRRASFGKFDFVTPKDDYNKLFRKDKIFRQKILNSFNKHFCLDHGIIEKKGFDALIGHIIKGRNDFALLDRLLAIEKFFQYFVYS